MRVRPTLYGWVLIFLLVWLPMTAVGSANNFLFIVFVILLGVALVSHWLGKRNVRLFNLSRRFPEEIFAGTSFALKYVVQTSFIPWGAVAVHFEEDTVLVPQGGEVLFPRVPAGEESVQQHYFTIASRGEHRIGHGKVKSSFPFGLARYERICGSPNTVLVFPRIQPIHEPLPLQAGQISKGLERSDPFGAVPYHFREYISGDPYKYIDWKKTARTGSFITRVLSEEASPTVVITLPRAASEEAISKAASVAVYCGALGIPVSLRGPGITVQPGGGGDFVRSLLTILARWDQRADGAPVSAETAGLVAEIDRTGNLTWKTSGGAHAA